MVGYDSLFPELRKYAATQLHALEGFLGYLHVGINRVHSTLDLLQLLCNEKSLQISSKLYNFYSYLIGEYKKFENLRDFSAINLN